MGLELKPVRRLGEEEGGKVEAEGEGGKRESEGREKGGNREDIPEASYNPQDSINDNAFFTFPEKIFFHP
jgi:hypothetical protein